MIDGGTTVQQGVCKSAAAVILKGPEFWIDVDLIPSAGETTGIAAIQVIAQGSDEAFAVETVPIRIRVRHNRILDRDRGRVIKEVASGVLSVGGVGRERHIQERGAITVIKAAAIIRSGVTADRNIGHAQRTAEVIDPSSRLRLIIIDRIADQGHDAKVENPAAHRAGMVGAYGRVPDIGNILCAIAPDPSAIRGGGIIFHNTVCHRQAGRGRANVGYASSARVIKHADIREYGRRNRVIDAPILIPAHLSTREGERALSRVQDAVTAQVIFHIHIIQGGLSVIVGYAAPVIR